MCAPANNIATFRFDFSPRVVSEIAEFAEQHMDDHRKEYKDAWGPWCEEHKDMIAGEILRLKQTGYDGNITDKMYKAGRYYFRKKSKKARAAEAVRGPNEEGTQEPAKKKRMYITVKPDTLLHIDAHINQHKQDNDFSPKTGYEKFLKARDEIVLSESENLKRKFEMSDADVRNKIKKTYKNRYYIITRD